MSVTDPMDLTFRALSSPCRRQILDVVKAEPGINLGRISDHFAMSRIGVMNHLRVLEEADLIHARKTGRTRCHYVNAVPIQAIHERWTNEFSALWAAQLTELKRKVEAAARATPISAALEAG